MAFGADNNSLGSIPDFDSNSSRVAINGLNESPVSSCDGDAERCHSSDGPYDAEVALHVGNG